MHHALLRGLTWLGLWIHGHVDAIDGLLRHHGGDMDLVEALGVGLGAAHLDTIWGLLHHGRGKAHALEVMSEGGEMGASCGGSRWVDLWVLPLLHGVLLGHLVPWRHREGGWIVLSTASE